MVRKTFPHHTDIDIDAESVRVTAVTTSLIDDRSGYPVV
jgi:hypothetical protein